MLPDIYIVLVGADRVRPTATVTATILSALENGVRLWLLVTIAVFREHKVAQEMRHMLRLVGTADVRCPDKRRPPVGALGNIPDEVEREMRAGEKAQWVGYPIPTKFAIKEGMMSFLWGIPWTTFCIFWESMAIKSGTLFMPLWGIPFIIIGLYLLTSPLWEYLRARRTVYVVSNQRLLILNGLLRPSRRSFAPPDIGSVEVDAGYDGIGSIIFSRERESDGEGGWNVKKIGFKAIPHVREAEEHIVQLKEQKMNPASPG